MGAVARRGNTELDCNDCGEEVLDVSWVSSARHGETGILLRRLSLASETTERDP